MADTTPIKSASFEPVKFEKFPFVAMHTTHKIVINSNTTVDIDGTFLFLTDS